ncbi:MAG: glycosyltransferase [Flavitalea sp.]
MKRLVFTVTNDLVFDQRMIRICGSLAGAGYDVTLIGRKLAYSPPLTKQPFRQKRLKCIFTKGKAFYLEYNLRLLLYLLFCKMDLVCAIDLDTIVPCYYASKLRGKARVYDAHELFCEMKEIVERPRIYNIWKWVERHFVPEFPAGYTVNGPIAAEFKRMYNVDYGIIKSVSVLQPLSIPSKSTKYILYQGAVNEGRSFETLIPAMQNVSVPLEICGDGNFMMQTRELVRVNGLSEKVHFHGRIAPVELLNFTRNAWIGITIFENRGLSNYYSLANRFFDYLHAGVPQVCVDYPVYRELNNKLPFAVLIPDTKAETISAAINSLLDNDQLYKTLQQNCLIVREKLNWQNEEKALIRFYNEITTKLG